MSREYRIESSRLPLCYFGSLSHPAVHGVYLEELPYSVSGTSEISSEEYSMIEDGLMNVEGISDINCPFTHSYAAYIFISESGTYRFYVHSNFCAEATIYDGERGVSVSVSSGREASTSEVGEITFASCGYYKVEVKYYSTGETSPVLDLHFGQSPTDMATRFELPEFRDFYILETEYATLLGDGTVLRPGEKCSIELHNLSGYYSIYGGTVTVWRADGEKTYPLEYGTVTIPMASIMEGNVYPSSGCSARVTVLASSCGGCGCGEVTSRTFTFNTTVVPENYRENSGSQCVCACSNPTRTENSHCISFSQNIGRTPWVTDTPVGQIFIEEDNPSQAMLTPEVLKYRHVMRRKLLNVSTTPSNGYLDVSDGCGQFTRYNLATGRATGLSVTEDSILMSSGTEWVEQFADRSQVVYDSTGQMVRHVTSGGIVLGAKDFGIDIVESNGQIRQIYSIADGLMNVTALSSSGSSGSFRIDWYPQNAVISSGATGYVTSTGANPVKSFSFSGTYQPALNNRNLKFHLTESRYGGTQTYYTGWEYSEEYDSDYNEMLYQGWAMYKGSAPSSSQQTDLRMITSGEYSNSNFHVSNVIVSGSCSLEDYVSSGGNALYERNAEVNAGGLGNTRELEYIGSDSDYTESASRVSSGYGIGKASRTEDRYGRSEYYEYDSLSRLKQSESSDGYDWLYTSYSYAPTPASGFPDYRPMAIVSSYYSIDPDDPDPSYYFKQASFTYQDNASVGRSETIVQSANESALTMERVWYPVSGAVVSGGTRTTALNYSEGRLKTVSNEDGTMTSYSYGAVAVSGMPSSGTIFTESATEGYSNNGTFTTLPGKSIRRVNSYNVCGDLVGQEQFVCVSGGAFVSIGSNSFQYNLTHQRTSAVYANGQTLSASWNCTGPTSEISVDGVTTTYQYDGLKRCIGKVTSSPNGTIAETYTLDYAGNIVQTVISGGGLTLSSSIIYDQEGRVVSSINPAGQTTSWEYSYNRRVTSEMHADGGEIITEITQAGMLDNISGTAANRQSAYYYTSDATMQVREEYEGTGDHWQCTCQDGHGHVVLTKAPSFNYDTVVSTSLFYDSLGRHVSTFTSGQPALSKTYDAMGNLHAEILSGGTSIRTSISDTNFVSSAGVVYQVAVTSVFASDTALNSTTTPLVTSKVTRLYPLSNALLAQETTVDVRGNSVTTSESYQPATKTHTFVQSYPGISNKESSVQRDGLLLSSVSILGGTTSFAYDGLHRQIVQTDPRGNDTSQVYNAYGQITSVIEPTGAVTSCSYDNMGRMTRIVNALGGTMSYTYNPKGQKLSESGNATYPVDYEYDSDTGLLSAHILHRNSNTDDTTYYSYDSCTQLLSEKTDANGNSVCFEYDSNGLLSKRTWARSTSNGADLVTSCFYNEFQDLTSVYYNDSTPNVSFTRDALGRETARVDGAGSHATVYNSYGEVTSERFPLATNSSALISRTYDSLGRPKTILLGGVTAAFYTYDAATGRYATVQNNSGTIAYSYLDKTDLPSVQTWKVGTSAAFLTVSNTYDAYNRLSLINANSTNQAAYVYDSLGRRKASTLQDSSTWNYTYNQRSEITSAIRKNASNVTQDTMRYGFDNIGNRTSSYENPTSKTYSANSLNQYTGINVVGSSSITPQYDNDGNMTGYGSWTYTWDAENRLVKAVNGTTRLEFTYDALSRRVAKKLYQGTTLSKHERYVYDGMKLLASYNAKSSYAKINTFLWQPFGADVPLAMIYNNVFYAYLVDANKNVLGLFNPSQSRVATYLYGPFGQIISSSGTMASTNPFRFSSEQFDADLGLVYYNYRYYSPELGRWLSKDPIREKGGWNLYGMCGNNVLILFDLEGKSVLAIFGIAFVLIVGAGMLLEYLFDENFKVIGIGKYYGNWTGQNYSAGKTNKERGNNPIDWSAEAIDEIDQAAKEHDACYEKCQTGLDPLTGECNETTPKTCRKECDKELCRKVNNILNEKMHDLTRKQIIVIDSIRTYFGQ